ncbi:MAG: 3-methyladenine DNA glycosylase AlkD [Candidatus Azotimanducaceae bacterium]|jgi:3-methyladenine DNA glycosylase AlkD
MPLFERWNADKNAWERRNSIVGLLEYAQKRKSVQPYEVLIQFVEPLLNDTDQCVQKGVGWTLRKIYNLYPEQTWQCLKQHAGDIPPQGYYAATEKLNKNDKALMNDLRKEAKKAAT